MSWVLRLPQEVEANVNKFRFEGTPSALAMKAFSVENNGRGCVTVQSRGSGTVSVRNCPRCYAMQPCGVWCAAFSASPSDGTTPTLPCCASMGMTSGATTTHRSSHDRPCRAVFWLGL